MGKPTPFKAKREIAKLDQFCRQLVFARDKGQCRVCGKSKPAVQTHWAHVISRSAKSTRWHLNNSMVLCYYHHFRWAHERPLQYAEFVREKIGQDAYDFLIRTSNQSQPLTPDVVMIWWAYLSDQAIKLGVKTP